MLGGETDFTVQIDGAAVHGDAGEPFQVRLERLDRDVFQGQSDLRLHRLHPDLSLRRHGPRLVEPVSDRQRNGPLEGKRDVVGLDGEIADRHSRRQIQGPIFNVDGVIRELCILQ